MTTMSGYKFDISVTDLNQKVLDLEPEPITKATFTVEISGKVFALEQIRLLIAEITDLPIAVIEPLDVYKVLIKLGYSVNFITDYLIKKRKLSQGRAYKPRNIYYREFKIQVIEQVFKEGKTAWSVGEELELSPRMVIRWVKEYLTYGEKAFSKSRSVDQAKTNGRCPG